MATAGAVYLGFRPRIQTLSVDLLDAIHQQQLGRHRAVALDGMTHEARERRIAVTGAASPPQQVALIGSLQERRTSLALAATRKRRSNDSTAQSLHSARGVNGVCALHFCR